MNKIINMYYRRDADPEKKAREIKQAGFDGVFVEWDAFDDERYGQIRALERNGLYIENAHLIYNGINKIWLDDPHGDELLRNFTQSVRELSRLGVKIAVIHLSSTFTPPNISQRGLDRYRRVMDAALQCGVTLAFENLRITSYLAYAMNEFSAYENLGFCWDCGHENIYNFGHGLPETYGDRLVALHIHDNNGKEDQHLLPFDGDINWDDVAFRIKKYKKPETALALEVHLFDKTREDYDEKDFLQKAFEAAVKLQNKTEK